MEIDRFWVMKNKPHLIPNVVAIFLLFGALFSLSNGYYVLLRVVVCCVASYTAYTAYTAKADWAIWTFGAMAVLFNPIVKMDLGRFLWFLVDIVSIVLFYVSIAKIDNGISNTGNINKASVVLEKLLEKLTRLSIHKKNILVIIFIFSPFIIWILIGTIFSGKEEIVVTSAIEKTINNSGNDSPGFSGKTFHGYKCLDDCSGHRAGYRWATIKDIKDVYYCNSHSNSFNEGCSAYVEENY